MAKSDLLKEAIADAKAVKETALENAKIALQEAFAPQVEAMFAKSIAEELEDEEGFGDEAPIDGEEMPEDEFGDEAGLDGEEEEGVEWIDNDISFKVGGSTYDAEIGNPMAEPGAGEGEEEPIGNEFGDEAPEGEELPVDDVEIADEEEDDLNLEAIIRELEGCADDGKDVPTDGDELQGEGMYAEEGDEATESIDEIIEAILREEYDDEEEPDEDADKDAEEDEKNEGKYAKMEEELQEAYATVTELKNILSEVNLLNAKLLYTNKLFRNFELNDAQKMKVIENFDRAVSTREAKLVFTTLAESFKRPTKKRVVKESAASRPMASTAPSKETTQVLSEGFELANRWKKLAGLI